MAFTHTRTTNFSSGSGTITASKSYTGSSETNLSETLAIGTNTALTIAVDVSTLVHCYIKADAACTILVNSTGAPTKTITLAADEPYVWPDGGLTNPIGSADVTVFYVTNVALVNLEVRVLQDSTP